METSRSIIIEDSKALNEIFGANDSNVKVFEDILGVPILTRGNEIFIDTDDGRVITAFKKMLTRLEEFARQGRSTSPEIIKTIYNSIDEEKTEKIDFLKKNVVFIPSFIKKVFPKSYNQAVYIDAIGRSEMVFGIGPAGTGKTYLAVAQALKSVLSHEKKKLVITRPVVEADESLGFLPGDLEQKIQPYLRPIYDSIQSLVPQELLKRLIENEVIEIAPLAYMRGRTFSNSFIILDEAQNTTQKQMLMFLTRIGEGSKAVITGDITQTDLPKRVSSGLVHAIPILKNIEEIKFVFLEKRDIVRNPLVKKIIRAYEEKS